MSELKLLNCPFCGGEARNESCGNYWVKCTKCGSRGSVKNTEKEAINQWNTRKPMANIVEKLEEEKGKVVIDGKKMYQEDYFIDIDKAINIVKQEINNGLE